VNIRIIDFSVITKLKDSGMVRISVIGESLVFSRMYYESNLYNFDFYNSQFDNLSNLNELSSVNRSIIAGTYSTSGFLTEVLLGAGFTRIYGNNPLQLNINNDYLSRTVMDNINFNEDIDINIIKNFVNYYYPVLDFPLYFFDDFSVKPMMAGDIGFPRIFFTSLNTILESPNKFKNPLINQVSLKDFSKQFNITRIDNSNFIDKYKFYQKAYGRYIINSYTGPKIIDDVIIEKPVFLNGKTISVNQFSSYIHKIEVPVAKDEIELLRENYKKLIVSSFKVKKLEISNYNPFFDLDVGMTIQYTSEKSEGYNSTFFFYANDITFMRSHRTEEFQVTTKLSALEF